MDFDPSEVKHVFDNPDNKTSTVVLNGGRKSIISRTDANALAKVLAKRDKKVESFLKQGGVDPHAADMVEEDRKKKLMEAVRNTRSRR